VRDESDATVAEVRGINGETGVRKFSTPMLIDPAFGGV